MFFSTPNREITFRCAPEDFGVIAEPVPEQGLGRAIMNRLRRAESVYPD